MISWVTDSVEGDLGRESFLEETVPKVRWEGSGRADREEGLRHMWGRRADSEMSRRDFMLRAAMGGGSVCGGSSMSC